MSKNCEKDINKTFKVLEVSKNCIEILMKGSENCAKTKTFKVVVSMKELE